MAFKIKDGIRIGTVNVFNDAGELLVNAPTATALETARTISLSGDATGSVSFDGTANADIVVTIAGLDTSGGTPIFTSDLVGDVYAGNGTSKILENGTDGTNAIFTGSVVGNASTASAWETARTVTFATGDITGNFTIDGSANVNDVALTIGSGVVENTMLVNDSITVGSTEIVLGATQTAIAGLTQLDVDNVRIDGNTISSTNSNGNIVIAPIDDGVVDVSSSKIINVATPVEPTDAANKQYVDDTAQGLRALPSAQAYSASNLDATYDNGTDGVGATLTANSNGAFPTIDGVTLVLGNNIVVNGQTNKAHNGSYELTTVGDAGTPWVLTRSTFDDEADEQAGAFEFITGGTIYGNTGWVMTVGSTPVVMGTTELEWVQFSGAGTYSAGAGLALTGTEFSVNVDDITIEINADLLRVKDGGISNTKLANSTITVAGDTGSQAIDLGDTLTVTGTNPVQTVQSGDTLTISVDDATTTTKGIASFNSADFSVSSGAVSINDVTLGTQTSGDYVESISAGTGIAVSGTGESASVTVSLSHLGIEDLTDPNSDSIIFWDDSAGYSQWLSIGDGLEISGSTIINTQKAFNTISVAGQDNIVAETINDTLTVVAGNNISISTDSATDSITINATSSTSGDNAFDNINTTVATTSPTVIDSFALATYRSAKYYIQISQGSDYQISEFMVIHDGTTTYDTEFAVLETTGELGTLSTAINGANVELTVTMASATSANIRIKRLLVEV